MILRKWEDLPDNMRTPEVKKYYKILKRKLPELYIKRGFDICASALMITMLTPVFIGIAAAIKKDSEGPVMYRQERVTSYGKKFRIHKFRSMTAAEKKEPELTIGNDVRITGVGKKIRKYRLDELPQLFDVLNGDMTFVGTRPEVPRYVDEYTNEMMATLLLPAGITGNASIEYKDESEELEKADDPVQYYIDVILPKKMKFNLNDIKNFSLINDLIIMLKTVKAVM